MSGVACIRGAGRGRPEIEHRASWGARGGLVATWLRAHGRAQWEQAMAKKGQDEALLENARRDLERNADLIEKKVISPQQYETQKALVAQLDATVKADEAAVKNTKVQLDYSTVISPLAGRVGMRLIDKGNVVHADIPDEMPPLPEPAIPSIFQWQRNHTPPAGSPPASPASP